MASCAGVYFFKLLLWNGRAWYCYRVLLSKATQILFSNFSTNAYCMKSSHQQGRHQSEVPSSNSNKHSSAAANQGSCEFVDRRDISLADKAATLVDPYHISKSTLKRSRKAISQSNLQLGERPKHTE